MGIHPVIAFIPFFLNILSLFFLLLSHSDSGDSLFLTQSVTSPSRTVKRHHPSNDPPCPFSQEVEDVHEKAGGRNAQHKDTGVSSDSDSETTYDVLLRRWKLLANSRGRINQRPRPSRKRVSPKWMGVPFLKKSVSVRKKQTIVVRMCKWQKKNKKTTNCEYQGSFRS